MVWPGRLENQYHHTLSKSVTKVGIELLGQLKHPVNAKNIKSGEPILAPHHVKSSIVGSTKEKARKGKRALRVCGYRKVSINVFMESIRKEV